MLNATNTSIFGTPSLNQIGLFLGIILAFIGIYKFGLFLIERKRRIIENRLNLFYIPLRDALNKFDIDRVVKTTQALKVLNRTNNEAPLEYIINTWCKFRDSEDYKKACDNDYLALDKTKEYYLKFTGIFNSNELFKNKITDLLRTYSFGPTIAMTYDGAISETPGVPETAYSITISRLTKEGHDKRYEDDAEHLFEDYNNLKMYIEGDIAFLKGKL